MDKRSLMVAAAVAAVAEQEKVRLIEDLDSGPMLRADGRRKVKMNKRKRVPGRV